DELRALMQAATSVTSELSLESVLTRIVEAAREIANAQYAALGVIVDGRMQRFITSGMTAEQEARIGSLPKGHGLLGALFQEGRPIRLARIADDLRSSGFPPHHPPMESFLGVPILVRGRNLGNLYLTNKQGSGEFTARDQFLVELLAAHAAAGIQNADLFGQAERRATEWRNLAELSREVAALLDPAHVLGDLATRARDLLDGDAAFFQLVSPDGQETQVAVVAGVRTEAMRNLRLPAGDGLSGAVLRAREAITLEDYATDPRLIDPPLDILRAEGIVSAVGVPFGVKGRPFGVLTVASRAPRAFSPDDVDLLSAFAALAAVAVENARLHEQAAYAATLEERDRIAREMHDGLAQVLGYVNTKAQAVRTLLEKDQVDRALVHLDQLSASARSVYADVREAILGLRTTVGPDYPLSRALAEYLETYERQTGIRSILDASDDVRLPTLAEMQVLRVVQEALTNVRKHAQASRVGVRIADEASGEVGGPAKRIARVTIDDDGVGFEVDQVDQFERYGLRMMRERVASLGGEMKVISHPGVGTSIDLLIPGLDDEVSH
ncbi:MAG TPA: GAF domain-containing sensor histidine kinase, partial [Chloroflexota bacterium]|nr:GAF domain-containing sensor histidine kinase [Chloroflexota bacterium]